MQEVYEKLNIKYPYSTEFAEILKKAFENGSGIKLPNEIEEVLNVISTQQTNKNTFSMKDCHDKTKPLDLGKEDSRTKDL